MEVTKILMYLAYSENYHHLLAAAHARLIISYGRKHGDGSGVYLPPGFDDFLIDSGGFQLAVGSAARDVNIKGYSLWLEFILDKYGDKVKGYMGLDTADWKATLRNYDYMRSEGLVPIPVWKAWWPEEMLDTLCKEYDYVAIGGVAFGASKTVLRHIFERIIVKYPETKFHMLGVGIRGGVAFKTYRPYSVDVSTWATPVRFGNDIVLDKNQVLKEKKLSVELRQKLKDDESYVNTILANTIKLMQSLETELDRFNDPLQSQMNFGGKL